VTPRRLRRFFSPRVGAAALSQSSRSALGELTASAINRLPEEQTPPQSSPTQGLCVLGDPFSPSPVELSGGWASRKHALGSSQEPSPKRREVRFDGPSLHPGPLIRTLSDLENETLGLSASESNAAATGVMRPKSLLVSPGVGSTSDASEPNSGQDNFLTMKRDLPLSSKDKISPTPPPSAANEPTKVVVVSCLVTRLDCRSQN